MERIDIEYNEYTEQMLKQLEKGVFMTTKSNGIVNTMTIAWGGINIVWKKKVFVAYVRYSRETYNMLEEADEFTINVPLDIDLREELGFCGTKSGRDYDKIKETGLNVLNSRKIDTPILSDCDLHYECKVIYKQAMEPNSIPNTIKNKYYSSNDFHVVYYGEIVDSYLLKGEK